jgi:hypothetical protein
MVYHLSTAMAVMVPVETNMFVPRKKIADQILAYEFMSQSCVMSILGTGSQRDVVYLGLPIAPSYMSPNAGGLGDRVEGSQPKSTALLMEPKSTLKIYLHF